MWHMCAMCICCVCSVCLACHALFIPAIQSDHPHGPISAGFPDPSETLSPTPSQISKNTCEKPYSSAS